MMHLTRSSPRWIVVALALLFSAAACRSAYQETYYRAMEEVFGKEKRDLLIDRVDNARDSQEAASEQFASALDEFSAVVGFEGGDLEAAYERLASEFEQSEERAEAVSERIDEVEEVAEALFAEWEDELEEYTDPQLRRGSERQLRQTRARYAELLATMRRAEATMPPVLNTFRDQVLFLKHNLNARAVASLEGTARDLRAEVATLLAEMEESIREADRFIGAMRAD